MITGNILILGAVAIIALFVVFGFLLGLLRGFRKSLFFTIIFIIVVVISFIVATVLAKNFYSGSTLWRLVKKVLPDSMVEGSEAVNSLKEFVRFYITRNYNEMLDSGMTAGESIVANQNAMGIIDGLFVMILKIVMLVASYIVLSILFYIVFGLIYLLFLRPKTYIESTTLTDEDGNETVEEREVKPKKKRLLGGVIGASKGLIKSMIILIPLTFLIGIVAQIEIPKSSSVSTEVRLASSSSNDDTLTKVVEACQKYDNSIGKIYFGLDDFVMNAVISYDVKGADGKKVKVVVSKELKGAIDIYNTIEREIGIDNLKDYDFKQNINSKEMKAIVDSVSKNLSNSKAITTALTAVGDEVTVILSDKLAKNDPDTALLFSEFDLTGKNQAWWKEQIAQFSDIFDKFQKMELDITKADTKEYNAIFASTTAESYENFVEAIFDNELLEMTINGGLKYAVKKLPSEYEEVSDTSNQVIKDEKVDEEFKSFSKLITFIRNDLEFEDGNVNLNKLSVKTLKDLVDTEILVRSKIAGKLVECLLKNTVTSISFDGKTIDFDKTIFARDDFSIHNELKSLIKVLEDGFTENYTLANLKDLEGTSKVGQICDMLESTGLKNSLIASELCSKFVPQVIKTITPGEKYDDIKWEDEFASISGVLENIYGRDEWLSNLTSINFETMTYRKLDNLEKSDKVWSGKAISRMLNGLAIPFIETISIDGSPISINLDEEQKKNILWRNELRGIVQIGLWASDADGEITDSDYEKSISSMTNAFGETMSVKVIDVLGEEVQDERGTTLIPAFANSALNNIFDYDNLESKVECSALATVSYTLADSEGKINLGTLGTLSTIKVETIDALESNTHKSQILMDKMAINLSEPMHTKGMINPDNNKSAWTSAKWKKEMPRIGEVLKTLANSEDEIVIDEINFGEDSEIKKSTFRTIELNIAYSEALENMFNDALYDSIYDSTNTDDDFPTPINIKDDEELSAWWNAEITGLLNIVYKEMGNDESIKLSNFKDTETVKVKVVKALYEKAIRTPMDGEEPFDPIAMDKLVEDGFHQYSNVGVSEYLQYLFKPQLRELSKSDPADEGFKFEKTYDWDLEMKPIIDLFLATRKEYTSVPTPTLTPLGDEREITFSTIYFGLYSADSKFDGPDDDEMGGTQAAYRNKDRLALIKEKIVVNNKDITYLQNILAPEMAKVIGETFLVNNHKPEDWDGDTWVIETTALDTVAKVLITDTNPKMEGIDFYQISDEALETICDEAPKSYLLQGKLSQAFIDAGINNTKVTTVSSLTETKSLMDYIREYDWNTSKNINEAYEALINTLRKKKDSLKGIKEGYYTVSGTEFNFYKEETKDTLLLTIYTTGDVVDGDGNPFLTNNVDDIINAVKTYSEYSLMISALDNSGVTEYATINTALTAKANTFVYSE